MDHMRSVERARKAETENSDVVEVEEVGGGGVEVEGVDLGEEWAR